MRYRVKITAVRQTEYKDLVSRYENLVEPACEVMVGQSWTSVDGGCPEGFCQNAWESVRPFVEALGVGEGHFYGNWMRDPYSAMVSCNDGFRPMSFYLERGERVQDSLD